MHYVTVPSCCHPEDADMTIPALDHRVELDDTELAVLIGLFRQHPSHQGAVLEAARASLLRRGLVQVRNSELHLPTPLLAALLPMAVPTITLTSEGHDGSASLLGGIQGDRTGLAVQRGRRWTVWAAATHELGDILANALPDEAHLLRMTGPAERGRVIGVELTIEELRSDPGLLDRVLREPPLSKTGPGAAE